MMQPAGDDGEMSTDDRLTALADWLKEGFILCTADEEILYINQSARQYLGLQSLKPGTQLSDAFPEFDGSVMQVQFRRTLEKNEALTADIPTQRRQGRWVNFQSIPLGDRLILLFRDITEEVERYRKADMKAAMLEAIDRNPQVSCVRLSQRGLIDMADKSIEDWLGICNAKLIGIRLHDVILREERHAFRNALDRVIEQNQPCNCDATLMANREEQVSVHCAMVPLRGAYGTEGVTIIMTRR
ncbi:PAS domain-containing protein [Erythrobacter sp. GH3-10]|uniref:PAS domain-containing protein n=2 Tax=Aurantiacibacter rhizosphaerae TaxID=2691582 RepID=A0A844XFJ6_9SPHN|nr:PAS domain-containing protein [Aurantiacibacter rhizosphaerae]